MIAPKPETPMQTKTRLRYFEARTKYEIALQAMHNSPHKCGKAYRDDCQRLRAWRDEWIAEAWKEWERWA